MRGLKGLTLETAEQAWLVAAKMAVEAKKAGFDMSRTTAALRDAKAMINECRANKTSLRELLDKIEAFLEEAWRGVFAVAEPMGEEFVKRLESEFKKVLAGEKIGEFSTPAPSFSANLPRGKWVKITASKKIGAESVEEIAQKHGAKTKRTEGSVLLSGSEEQVSKTLKEISAFIKSR